MLNLLNQEVDPPMDTDSKCPEKVMNLQTMTPKESQQAHGELVLVIDDEAAIRQVIRRTLEAFGYRVVTAEGGPEALSI